MKKLNYLIIITFFIIINMVFSVTYASIQIPVSVEDFIKQYNVSQFKSSQELDEYIKKTYQAKYNQLKDTGDLGISASGTFEEWIYEMKIQYNVQSDLGGNLDFIKANSEESYNRLKENINMTTNEEAANFKLEVIGRYITFRYSQIDKFYKYLDAFYENEPGSVYQERALDNLKECYNGIPSSERTTDMTDKLNKAIQQYNFNKVLYAEIEEETYQFNASDWEPDSTTQVTGGTQLLVKGAKIIGSFTLVGSLISVITLIILGIKYMLGSAEQKAEYKKTLWPYFIGAIMVFGIINILNIIVNVISTSL